MTISRTIQIQQYEPVTITLTEKHILEEDEDAGQVRKEVYQALALDLARFLNREIDRYSKED